MSARSGPGVVLRRATPDDAPLVLEFIRQLAEYEGLLDKVAATDAKVRESLFGEQPAAFAIIAECDGEPAGFAVYFFSYSTFQAARGLYLEDLFVLPRFRGRGLGQRLLAELARIAVEASCARMEWSVLDWNELALRVYRRVGARPLDEWTVQRLDGDALRALAAKAGPR